QWDGFGVGIAKPICRIHRAAMLTSAPTSTAMLECRVSDLPQPVTTVPDQSMDHRLMDLSTMARGSILRGAGLALGAVLTLVSSAILIRVLGVGSYGGFVLAVTLATFAATLADLGVGTAVSRMVAFVAVDERVGWARTGGRIAVLSGAVASV